MDYTEWIERQFFFCLEVEGLVCVDDSEWDDDKSDYDNHKIAWEKEFQEWRKYQLKRYKGENR